MNPDETGAQYQTAKQLLKRMDDALVRFKLQGVTLPDLAALTAVNKNTHASLGI
jgi:hypothetical protein